MILFGTIACRERPGSGIPGLQNEVLGLVLALLVAAHKTTVGSDYVLKHVFNRTLLRQAPAAAQKENFENSLSTLCCSSSPVATVLGQKSEVNHFLQ